ncbi:MAG: DUF2267 domain-containing protein [Verrucomicrobiota bacterium]
MQDLIQNLVSKVGVSEDQAQGAIEQVVAFLKDKLPDQFSGVIDSALSDGTIPDLGDLGGLADQAKGALGGLLGGDDK